MVVAASTPASIGIVVICTLLIPLFIWVIVRPFRLALPEAAVRALRLPPSWGYAAGGKWCGGCCTEGSVGVEVPYWGPPVCGVLVALITGALSGEDAVAGLRGDASIQPYSVLIIFVSLAYVCVALDVTGAFGYVALRIMTAAGTSGRRLFVYFYLLAGVMTIVASNDIVVLTLTPIIMYFSAATKTDPIPFVVAIFTSANTWSIVLVIGAASNIIVAQATGLTFNSYAAVAAGPGVLAGLLGLGLQLARFWHRIPASIAPPTVNAASALVDPRGALVGSFLLSCCLLVMAVAEGREGVPLWAIALGFALAYALYNALVQDRKSVV